MSRCLSGQASLVIFQLSFPSVEAQESFIPHCTGLETSGVPTSCPDTTARLDNFSCLMTPKVTFSSYPRAHNTNKQEGHCLGPVVLPAWFISSHPHPLCSVHLVHVYMNLTSYIPQDRLSVWSESLHPLHRVNNWSSWSAKLLS